MEKKLLFALDIGTRSVVGLVGEHRPEEIRVIASQRLEHHTRAMLDGQIHDVPEVAAVLARVKASLEESCGPLRRVPLQRQAEHYVQFRPQQILIPLAGVLLPGKMRQPWNWLLFRQPSDSWPPPGK